MSCLYIDKILTPRKTGGILFLATSVDMISAIVAVIWGGELLGFLMPST